MTHYVMTNEKKFSINKSKILWISWGSASLISSRSPFPNFRGLDADKKLTAWLYYLKDAGSIFMTANTLGINQSTVCKVVLEVCIAVTKYLGPKYLHLPKAAEEMKQKVSHFEIKVRAFFRFQFKQSAVWTLTAHGSIHYIMQKYLLTQT